MPSEVPLDSLNGVDDPADADRLFLQWAVANGYEPRYVDVDVFVSGDYYTDHSLTDTWLDAWGGAESIRALRWLNGLLPMGFRIDYDAPTEKYQLIKE